MWRKNIGRTNGISALLMLAVMAWLGGALVVHTLSHHHLHDHLQVNNHPVASGDDQCILLVFVSSPFAEVVAPYIPAAICMGYLLLGVYNSDKLFSNQSQLPDLRAPPMYSSFS